MQFCNLKNNQKNKTKQNKNQKKKKKFLPKLGALGGKFSKQTQFYWFRCIGLWQLPIHRYT